MADKAASINLSGTKALETFDLNMKFPGTNKPTGWVVTLAGPSHQKSLDYFEDAERKRLKKNADIERAQVNNRKWKGDEDKDPQDSRRETVAGVVARIVSWSPDPDFGAGPVKFSDDNAITLFMDRSNGSYFAQIVEYLTAENAFLTASAQG